VTVAAIRTQIRAVMAAVADVGVVHEYQRYGKDMPALRAFYFSAPHQQIRGWYIQRTSTAETGRIHTRSVECIKWNIHGFMSLDDSAESEKTMDTLIESLRTAFRTNDTLNGTVAQCTIPAPNGGSKESHLQLEDFGPVMFASVLCHAAKCSLYTLRYLDTQ
jgi:hypothetical protein